MNNKDIKYRLSQELGDLAELILKRKSPFENIPIHEEAVSYLYLKYLKYYDEINEPLRKEILKYIIAETGESEYYPSAFKPTEKLKLNHIIEKAMKKRKPDFLYDKDFSDSHTRYFSKAWQIKYKAFIAIGWGVKRNFLDFYVGVSSPFLKGIDVYSTTIASFFGGVQAVYTYDTQAEVFKAVNKALDLIEIILPHFLQRMEAFIEK
jgi:hypothetical protein